MILALKKIGIDEDLEATIYKEIQKCEKCGKISSYEYTACWDYKTTLEVAKSTDISNRGLCLECRGIKIPSIPPLQLELFDGE